jgi:hypothetical protein
VDGKAKLPRRDGEVQRCGPLRRLRGRDPCLPARLALGRRRGPRMPPPRRAPAGRRPREPEAVEAAVRLSIAVNEPKMIGVESLSNREITERALHDDRTVRLSRAVVGAIPCQARDPRSKQRHSRSKYADAYTL